MMDFLRKLRKIGRIWEMEWPSEVVVQMILFVGTAIVHMWLSGVSARGLFSSLTDLP